MAGVEYWPIEVGASTTPPTEPLPPMVLGPATLRGLPFLLACDRISGRRTDERHGRCAGALADLRPPTAGEPRLRDRPDRRAGRRVRRALRRRRRGTRPDPRTVRDRPPVGALDAGPVPRLVGPRLRVAAAGRGALGARRTAAGRDGLPDRRRLVAVPVAQPAAGHRNRARRRGPCRTALRARRRDRQRARGAPAARRRTARRRRDAGARSGGGTDPGAARR